MSTSALRGYGAHLSLGGFNSIQFIFHFHTYTTLITSSFPLVQVYISPHPRRSHMEVRVTCALPEKERKEECVRTSAQLQRPYRSSSDSEELLLLIQIRPKNNTSILLHRSRRGNSNRESERSDYELIRPDLLGSARIRALTV